MRKRILSIFLILTLLISGVITTPPTETKAASSVIKSSKELRGLWVSVLDFSSLGLANVNEKTYRANVRKLITDAKEYKTNAIFLQVRAFDDALWKSTTFCASSYQTKKASRNKKASATYKYDPLAVFCEEAASLKTEVHAWMNPYRLDISGIYYDPKLKASRKRVYTAIREVLKYNVAGIHFDDYFYHAQIGYVKPSKPSKVYKVGISPKKKRAYVNKLVRYSYKLCHQKKKVFGISPQGNYYNDMNSGADVETWMSKSNYIDYLCPQIYWSDQYGTNGRTQMYSSRLTQFVGLRKNKKVKLYIGLALYRCGGSIPDDPGWKKKKTNLRSQVQKLRKAGCNGYILFSARFLYNGESEKERNKLLAYLG